MASLSLQVIPLTELESLARMTDDYATRYDIPEEVYQSLLCEHESYWEFLQNNSDCYGNKEDWEKAKTHNRFICYMLMIRITEFMESRYKTG